MAPCQKQPKKMPGARPARCHSPLDNHVYGGAWKQLIEPSLQGPHSGDKGPRIAHVRTENLHTEGKQESIQTLVMLSHEAFSTCSACNHRNKGIGIPLNHQGFEC